MSLMQQIMALMMKINNGDDDIDFSGAMQAMTELMQAYGESEDAQWDADSVPWRHNNRPNIPPERDTSKGSRWERKVSFGAGPPEIKTAPVARKERKHDEKTAEANFRKKLV